MNTSDFVFVSKREWACEDVGGEVGEREGSSSLKAPAYVQSAKEWFTASVGTVF